MKQCNKRATVKFHMELLFTTTTRKQSRSGATPHNVAITFHQTMSSCFTNRENVRATFIVSSVYLRILGQPFFLIFPHFSPFFQFRTTFLNLLNILKNAFRYIIQLLHHHIIYLTNTSKSFQLNSISLKLFKVFKEFKEIRGYISNIYI